MLTRMLPCKLFLIMLIAMLLLTSSCGSDEIDVTVTRGNELAQNIELSHIIVGSATLNVSKINPGNQQVYEKGDTCVYVYAEVQNDSDQDVYVMFSANGYDSEGEVISWSMTDGGPLIGVTQLFLPSNSEDGLALVMNPAETMEIIEIHVNANEEMAP